MIASRHRNDLVVRPSGALTADPEVAPALATFRVEQSLDGVISVQLALTIGSLDSVTFTPQVLDKAGNWCDCTDPGALTLTASTHKSFAVRAVGSKFFRVLVTPSGDPTDSNLSIHFGYEINGGSRW